MGCIASKGKDSSQEVQALVPSKSSKSLKAETPQKADPVDPAALKCLENCELFKDFPKEELKRMAELLQREELAPNKIVTMEGERGDRMYFVSSGQLAVTAKDSRGFHVELRRFLPGDVFSEVSFFFKDHIHGTTTSTLEKSTLFSIPQYRQKDFQKAAPKIFKHIQRRATARETMTTTIENIPVLQSMSKQKRYILIELCTMRVYRKNENIVEQGVKSSKRFFIVSSGTLNVYVKGSMIRQLGPMDYFGEVSLVSDSPHSATVQVSDKEEAIVLEIRKDDFLSLLMGEEGVLAEFALRVSGTHSKLVDVLHHPVGYQYLAAYVTKEFAKENIDFWRAVDALESVQKSLIRKKVLRSIGVTPESIVSKKKKILETQATEIYETFLAPDASMQINISSSVSEQIRKRMEESDYSFDMFAPAKREILEMLEDDNFARFLRSDEFNELLVAVGSYELNAPRAD